MAKTVEQLYSVGVVSEDYARLSTILVRAKSAGVANKRVRTWLKRFDSSNTILIGGRVARELVRGLLVLEDH